MKKNRFYVVFKGRKPGIYFSWQDTEKEVFGYKGAIHKSYKCIELAKRAFASGNKNYKDPSKGGTRRLF